MESTPSKTHLANFKNYTCQSANSKSPYTPNKYVTPSPQATGGATYDRFIRNKAHPIFTEFYDHPENDDPNMPTKTKEEIQKYEKTLESQMFQGIDFSSFKAPCMKPILPTMKIPAIPDTLTPLSSTIKAYKVLDAPKIIDDFYLNVLDYSRGIIAIAPVSYTHLTLPTKRIV